jgi:AraC-like DNA-binding protein
MEDFVLRLAWVIEYNLHPKLVYPNGSYPNTIIWVVLEGKKRIEIKGVEYEVQAGDIIVIPPQTPRAVLPMKGGEHFHYITVGCDIRVATLEFVELYKLPVLIRPRDSEIFRELAEKSLHLFRESRHVLGRLRILNQPHIQVNHIDTDQTVDLIGLEGLFHAWFACFIKAVRPFLPDSPLSVDPRLQKVCAYIQQNLPNPMNVAGLAKYAYLSESHLRLLFRKTFGYSPVEYLHRSRLHRAKELLMNTEHSISQISELAGFETLGKFGRIFKKNVGMTAGEYRKKFRGNMHR